MKRPRWNSLIVLMVLALVAAACGGDDEGQTGATGGGTTGAGGGTTGAGGDTELHLLAWSGEVPDSIVAQFEEQTGISVTLDTFDSNESMIAKLEAGATGYDVVEPSQYAVQILIHKGLLEELDHSRLPSVGNLGEVFQDPSYDPGNQYSVPYVWGTTGLAYNDECVTEPVDSWAILWDPAYEGKIYMLDNMLAAYIAGLQINGFDANSTDPAEIEQATQSLIEQKDLLAGYNSSDYPQLVDSGQACVVQAWGGGSMAKVVQKNPHVHFILPKEGGTMWVDGFGIVKGAENMDAAYQWLEFVLQAEVAAEVTNGSGTATAVAAADALIDPDVRSNTAIYAPDEALANADFILDPGEAMQYFQEGWTQVKAA